MSESRLIEIMASTVKATFVNINKKCLFIKEYQSGGELLKVLIKLYHTPQPPILPVLIDVPYSDGLYYTIQFWYNLFTQVIEHIDEYSKYPIYVPKNNRTGGN